MRAMMVLLSLLKKISKVFQGSLLKEESIMKFRIKQIFIILGITIILFISLEVGFRVLYYQYRYFSPNRITIVQKPLALQQVLVYIQLRSRKTIRTHPLTKLDEKLGYVNNPGKFQTTQIYKFIGMFFERKRSFTTTVNKFGRRITKPEDKVLNKPEIWFFGGSFTFGDGLNDNETFPWIIQENIGSKYDVRNFGVNGYGTLHGLIQFREELKKSLRKPFMVVFVYSPFQLPRNVANPSLLAEYSATFPRAIVEDEQLVIQYISPVPENINKPDYSVEDMQKITKKILLEIKDLCNKNNVKPVLAIQTFLKNDPIVNYSGKMGFYVADIAVNLEKKYRLLPFDPHPNANANKLYAQKFLDFLRKKNFYNQEETNTNAD